MTSEVEEMPRFVTAGYGRHRSQWVNNESRFFAFELLHTSTTLNNNMCLLERLDTSNSNSPPHLGKVKFPTPGKAFFVKFPTPWVCQMPGGWGAVEALNWLAHNTHQEVNIVDPNVDNNYSVQNV